MTNDGRKIYNRVVMDMKSGKVLEEDSFWYNGPLALLQEGDGEEEEEEGEAKDNTYETLTNELNELKEGMKGNQQAVQQINEYLQQISQQVSQGGEGNKKKEESSSKEGEVPDNLELLDRKDFMNVIVDKVQNLIKQQTEGLGKEVEGVKENTERDRLQKQYEVAKDKHKDFDEWKGEMRTLFKNNPYLTMEQAYVLARAQSPDKAKDLDKKYTPKEEEETAGSEKFGGLTPTAKAVEQAKKKKKDLKGPAAGEEAWQIVMGDKDDVT